jgi:hypothetical protein
MHAKHLSSVKLTAYPLLLASLKKKKLWGRWQECGTPPTLNKGMLVMTTPLMAAATAHS